LLFGCHSSGTKDDGITVPDPKDSIKEGVDTQNSDSTLYTGWYFITGTVTGFKRQIKKSGETYNIVRRPIVTVANFVKISPFHEKDCYALLIWLDANGSRNLNTAINSYKGKRIGFILDNQLLRVQDVDDPQFASVSDSVDQRVYGQTLVCHAIPFRQQKYKATRLQLNTKDKQSTRLLPTSGLLLCRPGPYASSYSPRTQAFRVKDFR